MKVFPKWKARIVNSITKGWERLTELWNMEDLDIEMQTEFLSEAEELLTAAEQAFFVLENDRENRVIIDEIFRLAHNLKGSAGAVGFMSLSEYTHAVENMLNKIKAGELAVSDVVLNLLFEFKDQVVEAITTLRDNLGASLDFASQMQAIEKVLAGGNVAEEVDQANGALEQPDRDAAEERSDDALNEVPTSGESASPAQAEGESAYVDLGGLSLDEYLEQKLNPSAVKPESGEKKSVPDGGAESVASKASARQSVDSSIRVKLSKIDELNNAVGELSILQTVLEQRRFVNIQDEISNQTIGQMLKLFKEVQELSMSLRMLPLTATFQKMTRIVRDTSRNLNKKVQLELVGEHTEVDKTVLEKISDPLVHLIRNAVDHGLEDGETRVASGKDEVGKIMLRAKNEGSNLVIDIIDDGKGINPEIIEKKAIEKGIINAGHGLSSDQLKNLIFHPGFSTKEVVSDVSGRGVGMDVVKTNIMALGGSIKLVSELGFGSTFRIALPLSLAITDGMVFRSCGQKYVIPMNQVYEIVRRNQSQIQSYEGRGNLLKLRGEVLPLFGISGKLRVPTSELAYEEQSQGDSAVIVVRNNQIAFGVEVPEILSQQQIVIKKLGPEIREKKGLMGSSIMGDGKPAFIIDLIDMFQAELGHRVKNSA